MYPFWPQNSKCYPNLIAGNVVVLAFMLVILLNNCFVFDSNNKYRTLKFNGITLAGITWG